MTRFVLDQNTVAVIQQALDNGPGTNNINYVNAYNAIWANLIRHGGVNSGTVAWFEQAGAVDAQAFTPNAQGTFIWNYTKGAAASEGATVTDADLQEASNTIASTVFHALQKAEFVFDDAATSDTAFSPQDIIQDDAGAGLQSIRDAHASAHLDNAIWGGTLFAATELQDTSYFSDYGVSLTPGSRDATAILHGLFAGASAVVHAGGSITRTGIANIGNLDLDAINASLTSDQKTVFTWTFIAAGATLTSVAALAAGTSYIWDAVTGAFITLSSSDQNRGVAYAYEPDNHGLLTFNQGTAGAGTLAFSDGSSVSIGGSADITLASTTDGSGTDLQTILNYLSQIGHAMSLSQLDQAHFTSLHPVGAANTVTGDIRKVDDTHANVFYTVGSFGIGDAKNGPGAVVAGQATAVITDFVPGFDAQGNPIEIAVQVNADAANFLSASGDISRDTITGIQELDISGAITLTHAQFLQFNSIKGGGTITAADNGTFNLNDMNIDSSASFNLAASDWSGTTLIGNSAPGQTLTASMFGDDRLVAGNGTADRLVAGDGVDTLIGGTGGDTFVVNDGLAAGSMITGHGTGNVLHADGDISLATITGVQTLDTNNITLTVDQFNAFGAITNGSGGMGTAGGIITASTGGIYNLAGKSIQTYSLIAGSDEGTTLIDDGVNNNVVLYATLKASDSGNDRLIAGNANFGVLDASDSFGNNILAAGDGVFDRLSVAYSSGDNVLTAGNSSADPSFAVAGGNPGDVLSASFSSGDNILIAGNGDQDDLNANSSSGNNRLTVGDGHNDVLVASSSDGDNTITAGNGSNDLVQAIGSLGDNTIRVGNGEGDWLNVNQSSGNNTLAAGDGNNDLLLANGEFVSEDNDGFVLRYATGNNILIAGNGTSDILDAVQSTGSNTLVAGDGNNASSDVSFSSGDNTVTFGNGNHVTLMATFSSGNNHLTVGNGLDDVLDVTSSSGNNVLSAGNGDNDIVYAGAGNDTLTVGSGKGDVLVAGAGVDILNGGNGGDTFEMPTYTPAAGSKFIGGTGNDTLITTSASIDLTDYTISGIETLRTQFATLTAEQFAEFNTIEGISGFTQITVTTGGAVALAGKTTVGSVDLQTTSPTDTTLVGNDADSLILSAQRSSANDTLLGGQGANQVLLAGSGDDILIAGNGVSDVLAAGSGNDKLTAGNGGDTMVAGAGTDTLIGGVGNDTFIFSTGDATAYGGGGNDTYVFAGPAADSNFVIDVFHSGSGQSILEFQNGFNGPTGRPEPGITASEVTATRAGDDLVLTAASDPITVKNYFADAAYKVSSIHFADGTVWTSQQIDGVKPQLTGITGSPDSGVVFSGSTVELTLEFNEAVKVITNGVPQLSLSDGGKADYDAAATALLGDASKLVFDYHVSPNESTSSLAVIGFVSNGATVDDLAGNHADLSNVAAAFSALSINDTLAPPHLADILPGPTLKLDDADDSIFAPTVAAAAASGLKFLHADLPASTPHSPDDDPHTPVLLPFHPQDGFHLV